MSLKKNIINHFMTQVVGYLSPLLLFPFLSSKLGTESLGLYIFSLSVITLSNIITNFGFDISVSKDIAEGNNSREKLSHYFTLITINKVILCSISCAAIYIGVSLTHYYTNKHILINILIIIIFNSFSLNWLFQGLEKLYIYSRITIITKLLLLLMTFIFIKTKDDELYLYIISSIQAIILWLISYFWIIKYKLSFKKFKIREVINIFSESSQFFLARASVSLYSVLGSFFLGIFSGSLYQVAIYGVAQQLYKAGVYAISAISTPLTPYMARTKNYKIFFKVTLFSILLTILGAVIGFIFGSDIIGLIFGSNLIGAKPVLDIFMVTIIISIIGIHFGYPALIPLGKSNVANYSVIASGILQLSIITLLYFTHYNVTAVTIAISYLLCDLLMAAIRLISFYKNYSQ